jgi:hypothetical protein
VVFDEHAAFVYAESPAQCSIWRPHAPDIDRASERPSEVSPLPLECRG